MAFSFDGDNKLITLTSGTTSLNVVDLYSRWKDWALLSDNSKYAPAFSPVGGEQIDATEGTSIPLYAFLANGWKLKPQEASHTLKVSGGIVLVQGGGDPFVNTDGSFVVRINYQNPVQAVGVSGGGGSTIDNDKIIAIERVVRQTLALVAAQDPTIVVADTNVIADQNVLRILRTILGLVASAS